MKNIFLGFGTACALSAVLLTACASGAKEEAKPAPAELEKKAPVKQEKKSPVKQKKAGKAKKKAVKTADKSNKAEIRKLTEYTVRGGLPNFYQKINEGKHLKIAYFGGSITAQNGWRPQTLQYFRQQFPNARFEEIHAAIGGTGSKLGAFRIEHDVISRKPDLVFVEFAVNDSKSSPVEIRRSMEGIVRHIWRVLPETDICFVYTVTKRDMEHLLKGDMKRSTSVMEDIADHYSIPSVNMGFDVVKLAKENKLIMSADSRGMTKVSGKDLNIKADVPMTKDGKIPFSKDGVHPYENTGHVLYTNVMKRALPEFAKAGKPGPHTANLPAPVVKDNYEFTRVISPDDPGVRITGKAAKLAEDNPIAKRFENRVPAVWKLEPGAEISFRFKGSHAILYNLIGPGCGIAEITVDKRKPKTVRFFDRYCTYYRIATMPLVFSAKTGEHTVRIKIVDGSFDKRSNLFKHNQADFDKNPKKYEGKDAYIGAIFLVGDLVK